MKRRILKGLLCSLFLLVGLVSSAEGQILSIHEQSDRSLLYAGYYLNYGENARSFGASFYRGELLKNGRLEWNTEALFGVSIVRRQDVRQYSFRLPIHYLSMGAILLAEKLRNTESRRKLFESPWRFVFLAPNSSWKLYLTGRMQLTFTMNTDYLFFGHKDTDKGVLFTPSIGISRYFYPGVHRASISVTVGHALFWNFDGRDQSDGWTIGVSMVGFPLD